MKSSSPTNPPTVSHLTHEEANNPRKVIARFYEQVSLSSCHAIFNELTSDFPQALSGNYHSEISVPVARLFVEKVPALLEAAYLLGADEQPPRNLVEEVCRLLPVHCILEPNFNERKPDNTFRDWLVIVSAAETQTPAACEERLAQITSRVRFTVFKSSFLHTVQEKKGRYFSEVFEKAKLYYQSEKFEIPKANNWLADERVRAFQFRIGVAAAFRNGMTQYYDEEDYRMAVFMSHQLVEHTLLAVLDLVMGVTYRSHNLSRMLRICGFAFPAIHALFANPEEESLLKTIREAYVRARYDAQFEMSRQEAGKIVRKGTELFRLANRLFAEQRAVEKDSVKARVATTADVRPPGEVRAALRVFFDASSAESFKTSFFYVLNAYAGEDFYRYGDPVGVSFTIDNLRELLLALKPWVSTLSMEKDERSLHGKRAKGFVPGRLPGPAREAPTTAIAHFFLTYERWQPLLDSIQFFALCRQSGIDDGEGFDTLTFYHDVGCLVDACEELYGAVRNEDDYLGSCERKHDS